MRKTIKNVKYPFPRNWTPFAQYTFDVGDKREATACWKYRTFSYNEGFGSTIYIMRECPDDDHCEDNFVWGLAIGWKTGMEADGKQAGVAELFLSQDNMTRAEESLQQAEKTRYHFNLYADWQDLFEWQSVCYAISMAEKAELIYVNGRFIMGYEWPKEFVKGWGDNPLNLRLGTNWRGEVTDLNIYDSAFDDEQMIAWTTSCDEPAKGEILAWSPEQFNLTNNNDTETILSEVAASDLCSKQDKDQHILEMFDNHVGKSPLESEEFCARLNGKLNLVPVTEEDAFATLNEIVDYVVKVNISWEIGVWVAGRAFINGTEMMDAKEGYQAYPKNGEWTIKDPYTDDILGVPFITVPSGATYARVMQECLACFASFKPETVASFGGKLCKARADCVHSFSCASQICDRGDVGWGLMCRFDQKLRLRLKGLCKEAKVDTEYLLLGYEVLDKGGGHRRKFGGSTGWLLAHNKEKDEWQLQHQHYPHLILTMEDKDTLPVGLHSWLAGNDTCNLGQTSSVHLQLSACLPHQFTCRDGKCVNMETRCDNVEVGQSCSASLTHLGLMWVGKLDQIHTILL